MNKFWNYKLLGLVKFFAILFRVTFLLIYEKINSFFWKYNFKRAGNNLFVQKNSVIRFPGNISIGNSVNIGRNVEIFSEYSDSFLNIGDNININKNVQLDFTGNLAIEDNVVISENSVVLSHSHGYDPHSKAIRFNKLICSNVWIGQNTIIMPQVAEIGKNSIIAAGSIVTKNVMPNTIVAGNPARVIKNL